MEKLKTLKTYYQNNKKRCQVLALCLLAAGILLFSLFGFVDVKIITPEGTKAFRILRGSTVAEALVDSKIALQHDDALSHELTQKLFSPTEITLYRARDVIVGEKGKTKTIKTALQKEEDILRQAGIQWDESKKIFISTGFDIPVYYQLSENETITLSKKSLGYKTIKTEDPELEVGKTKTIKEGKKGTANVLTLNTKTKQGKTEKKVIATQTVSAPIPKEVLVGTKALTVKAGGKSYTAYKKVIIEATAYCSCSICCGPYDGTRTADGSPTKMYHTVAAPATYDFGTMLYIPYFDDSPNAGIFEVEDRGGAIQGNRIDIYFSTHEKALAFGRRTLEMYVLK